MRCAYITRKAADLRFACFILFSSVLIWLTWYKHISWYCRHCCVVLIEHDLADSFFLNTLDKVVHLDGEVIEDRREDCPDFEVTETALFNKVMGDRFAVWAKDAEKVDLWVEREVGLLRTKLLIVEWLLLFDATEEGLFGKTWVCPPVFTEFVIVFFK